MVRTDVPDDLDARQPAVVFFLREEFNNHSLPVDRKARLRERLRRRAPFDKRRRRILYERH